MLTPIELETLFEIINCKPELTLEQTLDNFLKDFTLETQNWFRPCYCLLNMLVDNLLTSQQRLISFALLIVLYKQENFNTNPFALNVIDIVLQQSNDEFEKNYVFQLISDGSIWKEKYNKMTVNQLNDEQEQYLQNFDQIDEVNKIRKQIQESLPKLGRQVSVQTKRIISDFSRNQKSRTPLIKSSLDADKIPIQEMEPFGFSPDFLRPIPTALDIQNDEFQWLNQNLILDVVWDFNIINENNLLGLVKELMIKSYKTQLSEEEQKVLLQSFEKDDQLVYNCGLSPTQLQDLVDKNPLVAGTVLIKLHQSPLIHQYYEKLIHMELNLSSLEVVNRLVHSVLLPKEFLHLYISNCIQQCEQSKKDKNNQNRLVRLVCVFIRSMIKSKNINPKDMYIELQAFCIEFSKISEASQLFKMLKNLESG